MNERVTHSFTFDGIDVEDLGLHYAPDLKGTQNYSWAPNTAKIHEISFEAHDGGYYYGRSLGPKEFTLRCYYEQTPQEEGLMAAIYKWFYIGHKGNLIFERRPWIYYYVVITGIDIDTMYNFQNGLVTIQCKAYKPYGISNILYNTYTDDWDKDIVNNNTYIWNSGGIEYPTRTPITSTTSVLKSTGKTYYLYNAGDKSSELNIIVKSDTSTSSGISFTNKTNNTYCKTQPLDSTKTFTIDAKNMMTYDSDNNLCYQYHKAGYINLNPDVCLKDYTVASKATGLLTLNRDLTPLELIWINGGHAFTYSSSNKDGSGNRYQNKIISATGNQITVNGYIPGYVQHICTFNEIFVIADVNISIETLTFDFDFKFD